MQANVKTKTALKAVSSALNEAEILFGLDLVKLPNRLELSVHTNINFVQFTCVNTLVMSSFLDKLQALSPDHTEDIKELLLELVS